MISKIILSFGVLVSAAFFIGAECSPAHVDMCISSGVITATLSVLLAMVWAD